MENYVLADMKRVAEIRREPVGWSELNEMRKGRSLRL